MEKHVLIFSASWCGPCNQMKYYVWQNKNVQKALSKFDSVQKIDIDANKAMATTYQVNSVPRVYVVNQEGRPLKAAGFMGVDQALEFLND